MTRRKGARYGYCSQKASNAVRGYLEGSRFFNQLLRRGYRSLFEFPLSGPRFWVPQCPNAIVYAVLGSQPASNRRACALQLPHRVSAGPSCQASPLMPPCPAVIEMSPCRRKHIGDYCHGKGDSMHLHGLPVFRVSVLVPIPGRDRAFRCIVCNCMYRLILCTVQFTEDVHTLCTFLQPICQALRAGVRGTGKAGGHPAS